MRTMMLRRLLLLLFTFLGCALAEGAMTPSPRTAADCTTLADGLPQQLCTNTGDGSVFQCTPGADNLCNTAGEWLCKGGVCLVTSASVGATVQNKTVSGGDSAATATRAASANIIAVRTHNTDCTSMTDGVQGEVCVDEDDGSMWVCLPSAGLCDTVAEWLCAGGPCPAPDGSRQISFQFNNAEPGPAATNFVNLWAYNDGELYKKDSGDSTNERLVLNSGNLGSGGDNITASAPSGGLSNLTVGNAVGTGAVVRATSPTGLTVNVEGASNAITILHHEYVVVGTCTGAAGVTFNSLVSLPLGTAPTGTCTLPGTVQGRIPNYSFADTVDSCIEGSFVLPPNGTIDAATVDVSYYWFTAGTSTTTGWCTQLACFTNLSGTDSAYPAQSTSNCISAASSAFGPGFWLSSNDTSVTATGCAAGNLVKYKACRDADGSVVTDANTSAAQLADLSFLFRWTQ